MLFLARRLPALMAALALAVFVPFAAPSFAQSQAAITQPDLVAVMLWTLAVVIVAMLILTLGYLYRRARGAQDEIIPTNVDPYYAVVGHEETDSTGELHPELPPIPEHGGGAVHDAHGGSH
jgi:hypothetical protein